MAAAAAGNTRTQRKAAIRRASAAGRRDMRQLDRRAAADLTAAYTAARAQIEAEIASYADGDGSLRLATLQELLAQVRQRLDVLGQSRDDLLDTRMADAVAVGTRPFEAESAIVSSSLVRVSDDALRFVRTFVAEDGLQLSDRLWRLDAGAKATVGRAIESAVIQGHSAARAAADFLARGEPVPPDLLNKVDAGRASTVARSAGRALMVDDGNAYRDAVRVFRTEINRAHGEAYRGAAQNHPDAVGTRFLLSPNHPRADICDLHASVNRYGLGPGVYPFGRSPWPAHPETLSFEEVVFADEVSESDRQGKETRIDWLKRQTPGVQEGVLASRKKRAALEQDVLRENEIGTPWRILRKRYERRGIAVDDLVTEPVVAPVPRGTRSSRREDLDYVRSQGLSTGWEFASAHDRGTGELLFRKTSRSVDHVSFNRREIAVLDDPARRVELAHNHPSSSSLSDADLRLSGLSGIEAVVAVGHDGTTYIGKARTSDTRLRRGFKAADRAVRRAIDAQLANETIDLNDAHYLWSHLKNAVLERGGLITYKVSTLSEGSLSTAMDKVGAGWLRETTQNASDSIDWEDL